MSARALGVLLALAAGSAGAETLLVDAARNDGLLKSIGVQPE